MQLWYVVVVPLRAPWGQGGRSSLAESYCVPGTVLDPLHAQFPRILTLTLPLQHLQFCFHCQSAASAHSLS